MNLSEERALQVVLGARPSLNPLAFDPSVMKFRVAFGAILRAVRSGRLWDELETMGLSREEHGTVLLLACDAELDLRLPSDVSLLIRMCPQVVPSALLMLAKYMHVTTVSRGNTARRMAA